MASVVALRWCVGSNKPETVRSCRNPPRPSRTLRPAKTPTMNERIHILQGDITRIEADAIVNAANTSLLGGGGVDGAIHRAAGPELALECRQLHGCKTGAAKITAGYRLPARWVIHTVGPVWQGGGHDEDALLARCYRNALALAVRHNVRTIAFPAISTGIYAFPADRAARIALDEIDAFLKTDETLTRVLLVCFEEHIYHAYLTACNDYIEGETR